MTKTEQARFIRDMTDRISADMIAKVEDGRIPANWDGRQLRRWIADTFTDQAWDLRMDRTADRAYRNDVLINNL